MTSIRHRVLAALAAVLLIGTAVEAAGPVPPAGVPGSVVVTDDGAGTDRWGRSGGRTITYTVVAPGTLASLRWSIVTDSSLPIPVGPPSAAFDGAVTSSTPEQMTFSAADSNLASGIARWTGQASYVHQRRGSVTLPTRFTITVSTIAGAPVPLSMVIGSAFPIVDAKATPAFRVNMLFEANAGAIGGSPSFQPLLSVYDAAFGPVGPPPPGSGPVMTEASIGFFYEAGGGTDPEHTALVAQIAALQSRVDTTAAGVQATLGALQASINVLAGQVGSLSVAVPPGLATLPGEVAALASQVTALGTKIDGLASTRNRIDVTAYREYRTDGKRAWILQSTRGGQLVPASLFRVSAIVPKTTGPAVTQDMTSQATVVQILPGVHEVTLIAAPPTGTQVFQFELNYVDGAALAVGSVIAP